MRIRSLSPRPRRSAARRLQVAALTLLLPAAALAAPTDRAEEPFDHGLYARLLEQHTRTVPDLVGTRVDYRTLRDSADWKRLVAQVRSARPSALDRPGRLAFWINAYNILTIDLILEHHPVESIRDIGSFFSPVWSREVATIERRRLSLGDIEHQILRKMAEPRIHAAIVCASTSCPSLARRPYRAETLDADLEAATRTWLASRGKGVAIDRERSVVRISKIFDWFEEDFAAAGGVLAWIAPRLDPDDGDWLLGPGRDATIRYLPYDWTLNDFVR